MTSLPPAIEETQRLLRQAYPAVVAELHAVPESGWIQLDGADGPWGAFVFDAGVWPDDFPDVDFDANKACMPRTWAVLSQLPDCRMVGLTRIRPGVRVPAHTDPRPDDQIRVVLAVQLAPREHWWAPGHVRLLDTSRPHGAFNDGERDRILVICDVQVDPGFGFDGIDVWDPELGG